MTLRSRGPVVSESHKDGQLGEPNWPVSNRKAGLLGSFLVVLLLVFLLVFLVWVALFAGLAVLMGAHATRMGAFLAGGFGLFTAGLLLFLLFLGGNDRE